MPKTRGVEDWDWRLVRCPYCGNYIVTQARIYANCQACGHSVRVTPNTVYSHESKGIVLEKFKELSERSGGGGIALGAATPSHQPAEPRLHSPKKGDKK